MSKPRLPRKLKKWHKTHRLYILRWNAEKGKMDLIYKPQRVRRSNWIYIVVEGKRRRIKLK